MLQDFYFQAICPIYQVLTGTREYRNGRREIKISLCWCGCNHALSAPKSNPVDGILADPDLMKISCLPYKFFTEKLIKPLVSHWQRSTAIRSNISCLTIYGRHGLPAPMKPAPHTLSLLIRYLGALLPGTSHVHSPTPNVQHPVRLEDIITLFTYPATVPFQDVIRCIMWCAQPTARAYAPPIRGVHHFAPARSPAALPDSHKACPSLIT